MMGQLPPFEEREAYGGFFPALWQTWLAACFRPAKFFESVGNSQNLTPALFFGVLVGWVGDFVGQLWSVLFQAPLFISFRIHQPWVGKEEVAMQLGWLVALGLLGWLFALLNILLLGLLFHLFLLLFGGAKQGLVTTLRVVAYAHAPALFLAIPCLGPCVAVIWGLVLDIIGLATAHRTEKWRSALAVLAPVVVCLLCLVGGAMIAAFVSQNQKVP
ncbi:MAG: hypothetical protein C4295_01040 [Candidatus Fervidibacterota bacterium]